MEQTKKTVQTSLDARLRRMTADDLYWVFEVRNEDHVRKGSRHGEPISWEDHLNWWAQSAISDRFIFECDGIKRGVVLRGQDGYWSFYMENDSQGSGLATIMLSMYLRFYRMNHRDQLLKAQVKRRNLASLKLHHKLGFKRIASKSPEILEFRLDLREKTNE